MWIKSGIDCFLYINGTEKKLIVCVCVCVCVYGDWNVVV